MIGKTVKDVNASNDTLRIRFTDDTILVFEAEVEYCDESHIPMLKAKPVPSDLDKYCLGLLTDREWKDIKADEIDENRQVAEDSKLLAGWKRYNEDPETYPHPLKYPSMVGKQIAEYTWALGQEQCQITYRGVNFIFKRKP